MPKKAIYLDARERDLVRRVFDYTTGQLSRQINVNGGVVEMALRWTRCEVNHLRAKFEEDEPTES